MSKAVLGASFNPFHYGHWDIIYQAANIFDKLYVVVAQNAGKDCSHTSVEAIKKDIDGLGDVEVCKLPPEELLVNFARKLGADCLIRGLRGVKDFMAEMEMGDVNAHLSNIGDTNSFEINTIMLMSAPQNRYTSSSMIRGLPITENWGEIVKEFMPKHSAEEFIGNTEQKIR